MSSKGTRSASWPPASWASTTCAQPWSRCTASHLRKRSASSGTTRWYALRNRFDSHPCDAPTNAFAARFDVAERGAEVEEEMCARDVAVAITERGIGPVDDHRLVPVDQDVERMEVAVARDLRARVELGQQGLDSPERGAQAGVFMRRQPTSNQSEASFREALAVRLRPPHDWQRMEADLERGETVDQARRSPRGSLHRFEQRRVRPSLHHLDREVAELTGTEDRDHSRRRVGLLEAPLLDRGFAPCHPRLLHGPVGAGNERPAPLGRQVSAREPDVVDERREASADRAGFFRVEHGAPVLVLEPPAQCGCRLDRAVHLGHMRSITQHASICL